MRKILVKLCKFLEKKLYLEPTWQELFNDLNKTRYQLFEAEEEIKYLQNLITQFTNTKQGW